MITESTTLNASAPMLTRHWSKRFLAWMLLLVFLASPLAGGAGAFLTVWLLSQVPFFKGLDVSIGVRLIYLGAALACLLPGPVFWWLCVMRPQRLTPGRGALVGVLGSLVAHPLAWLFALLFTFLVDNKGFLYLGPDKLRTFTDVLVLAGFFSWYSLMVVGWLTALIGGLAGAGVAWGLARRGGTAQPHAVSKTQGEPNG